MGRSSFTVSRLRPTRKTWRAKSKFQEDSVLVTSWWCGVDKEVWKANKQIRIQYDTCVMMRNIVSDKSKKEIKWPVFVETAESFKQTKQIKQNKSKNKNDQTCNSRHITVPFRILQNYRFFVFFLKQRPSCREQKALCHRREDQHG